MTAATTDVQPAQQRDKPALIVHLEQVADRVQALLPEPERFQRVLLTSVQRNPQLMQCSPASVISAALLSAQLDLTPGPLGHVWLIPRRNHGVWECTWMLGYRGMVELARRAGVTIECATVHAGDEFDYELGFNPRLVHRPDVNDATRGDAISWYAIATPADGRKPTVKVLTRADVEARRAKGNGDSPAWRDHYDAMARKSAIRALWQMLPMLERDPAITEAMIADEDVVVPVAHMRPIPPPTSRPVDVAAIEQQLHDPDQGGASSGKVDAPPQHHAGDGAQPTAGEDMSVPPPDEEPPP